MSYRLIQLRVPENKVDDISSIREMEEVLDYNAFELKEGGQVAAIIVETEKTQNVTDRLQDVLGDKPEHFATVVELETVLPKPEVKEEVKEDIEEEKKAHFFGVPREELYDKVERGISTDSTFFLTVILSTIVAAIGLLMDDVAVIIGSMVIAPLLGPNLALAFGTVLGDLKMIRRSMITNLFGFGLCLGISTLIGLLWPYPYESNQLIFRQDVNFGSVVLALAAGGAAVLSLTKGVSSTLVGVMVAVALLPPAVAFGLYLGSGEWAHAYGSALLLAVMIVCINISAKITFLYRGIAPRQWYEKKKSRDMLRVSLAMWGVSLLTLLALIAVRNYYFF